MNPVWMEKYRPKDFQEVIGQEKAIARLESLLGGSMPHLLLWGPSGSGKTTCALIVADRVLGGNIEGNYLELEASDLTKVRKAEKAETDDDGNVQKKEVVRRESSPLWRIKEFATTGSLDGVRFRVVYVAGADQLPKDVQEALRRTMEVYSKGCLFILSCEHPSMLIDPIRSRCASVGFVPIPRDSMSERLSEVASMESREVPKEVCTAIAQVSKGDMRKAMGILQASCSSGKTPDFESIYAFADTPRSDTVVKMLEQAMAGKMMDARSTLDTLMLIDGLTGREVLREIQEKVFDLGLSDQDAVRLMDRIGETDFHLAQCGSGGRSLLPERIQLENLLAYVVMSCKPR